MPRRIVSDRILFSGDLIDQPLGVRWLWLALVLSADDCGYCRSDTHYLRARCVHGFRFSDRQIESALEVFMARGMLSLVGGAGVVKLVNWRDEQKLKNPRSKYTQRQMPFEEVAGREAIRDTIAQYREQTKKGKKKHG